MLDLLDGMVLGPAFIAHGAATFTVMAFFCEGGISHLMTPMLLMEVRKKEICEVVDCDYWV